MPKHSSEVLDLLVQLVQTQKESSISSVKSRKLRISIPAETICHLKCSIDRSITDSRIPVTFEENDTEIWKDIVPLQSTVMMTKSVQTHVQVPVLSNSHHNAVLQPKVTLGSFHQIQPISPLESLKLTDKEKQY